MSRKQRKRSESGYYHIMVRGNDRKNIFQDIEDKERFIALLAEKKQDDKFYLHAFCLMDNHIHLMISEGNEDISAIMKRILVSYVYYYNKKYKKLGHLFHDRFRSENVKNDAQALTLMRYIHQNPLKAGIVKKIEDYSWSSYQLYINAKHKFYSLIDKEVIMGLFNGKSINENVNDFIEFNKIIIETETFKDIDEPDVMEEKDAKDLFSNLLNMTSKAGQSKITAPMILEFKEKTNLSNRKIAEIMNINKNKVNEIIKKKGSKEPSL